MARRVALAVALLLLAGSCAKAKTPPDAVGGATPSVVTTITPSPSTTTGSGGPGAGPEPGRVPPSTAVAPSGDPALAAIQRAARRPPGAMAGVVLAPGPATSLVLDVRAGAGAAPGPDALDAMARLLQEQSGKPVTVTGPTALRGVGGGTHTAAEIRSLADTQGTPDRSGVAVVHVLYLAGRFETGGVLGVAVRGDTLAVFTDAVRDATSPLVTRSRLERAVVTHELGHLLGLVDLFLDDNRDDPDHPGHSTNPASVMYWAVETSLVGQVLGGPPPVDFDSNDLADLRRIRSGAPAA